MNNLFSLQGIIELAIRLPMIFLCLAVHEFAHGYIAYKVGDDTAKNAGRLTLNPLAHIDWMGALSMLLFRFGWAKPVPVNPYNFTKSGAKGIIWVSLAGPVSNFIFAFVVFLIWGLLYVTVPAFAVNNYVWMATLNLVSLNIGLGVFNLVPIPPLDGSKVLMYFASFRVKAWLEQNQMMLYMFLMLAVFSGTLGRIIIPISNALFTGMWKLITIIFPQLATIIA